MISYHWLFFAPRSGCFFDTMRNIVARGYVYKDKPVIKIFFSHDCKMLSGVLVTHETSPAVGSFVFGLYAVCPPKSSS